jgi:trehalose synthase
MSLSTSAIQRMTLGLHSLEHYEPLIGAAETERILRKADRVRTMNVVHVSSTFYGGGVTEILTPLTLMMNAIGIETDWHLIQGTPGFFSCTKKRYMSRCYLRMPPDFISKTSMPSSCMIHSRCRS